MPDTGTGVFSLATITGVGVRARNEDAGFADYLAGRVSLIVCDGLGGEVAGDEASEAAVRAFCDMLSTGRSAATLQSAVREAALAVAALNKSLGLRRRAGTTLAAAVIEGDVLHWANVGDSRIYLIRDGQARCLSTDHSVPMMLYQLGEISAAEVRHHPDRGRLTRSLGREVPEWDRGEIGLLPGDVVLVCSDGIWEPLNDEVLATLCSSEMPLHECLRAMAEAITALGVANQDNYTAVAARWDTTDHTSAATRLAGTESVAADHSDQSALRLVARYLRALRATLGFDTTEPNTQSASQETPPRPFSLRFAKQLRLRSLCSVWGWRNAGSEASARLLTIMKWLSGFSRRALLRSVIVWR